MVGKNVINTSPEEDVPHFPRKNTVYIDFSGIGNAEMQTLMLSFLCYGKENNDTLR